jgi:hypothetical protein
LAFVDCCWFVDLDDRWRYVIYFDFDRFFSYAAVLIGDCEDGIVYAIVGKGVGDLLAADGFTAVS